MPLWLLNASPDGWGGERFFCSVAWISTGWVFLKIGLLSDARRRPSYIRGSPGSPPASLPPATPLGIVPRQGSLASSHSDRLEWPHPMQGREKLLAILSGAWNSLLPLTRGHPDAWAAPLAFVGLGQG